MKLVYWHHVCINFCSLCCSRSLLHSLSFFLANSHTLTSTCMRANTHTNIHTLTHTLLLCPSPPSHIPLHSPLFLSAPPPPLSHPYALLSVILKPGKLIDAPTEQCHSRSWHSIRPSCILCVALRETYNKIFDCLEFSLKESRGEVGKGWGRGGVS